MAMLKTRNFCFHFLGTSVFRNHFPATIAFLYPLWVLPVVVSVPLGRWCVPPVPTIVVHCLPGTTAAHSVVGQIFFRQITRVAANATANVMVSPESVAQPPWFVLVGSGQVYLLGISFLKDVQPPIKAHCCPFLCKVLVDILLRSTV